LGFFYGVNIAGAVFGCLVSGFYLLRNYDVTTATYAAAALNIAVSAIAFILAAVTPKESAANTDAGRATTPEPRAGVAVYVAIALSGFCALSGEAIWTRMLGLLFGASVYTLSMIVAVFLVGLGIGSSIGSLLCRVLWRPRIALGWCQMLAAG